ncbi:hypothetical protein [uncultured Methylobacterium sp.]|uniref:hypothetical protein n=1 Tax=uncultured Methylobacterium sp. TaxID=157278 RepID=UPI0035CAC84F
MPSRPSQSVLFFRLYREVTVPLYADMVAQICASPDLPLELATIMEDIGHEFIGFGSALNAELVRRGLLDEVADADQTVEARIDALVEEITARREPPRSRGAGRLLSQASTQQALKAALVMALDLPSARQFFVGASPREAAAD